MIVAVRGPDQMGKRDQQAGGQTATEAGGFLGKIESEIDQRPSMVGAVADYQRFHKGNEFASVLRFDVRFHDRIMILTTTFIS